jgi:D-glucosaminate-6-phosphate ammonia-lyase
MEYYDKLGVTRVINCFDNYTFIGGAIISDRVRAAMEEADKNFAWIWELEEKAGKRIAELTGAEAAFVTSGAFGGLSMAAAACIAGREQEKMSRLPDTTGMRNEVIIQRCLRDFRFDRSMTVAGGRLVEVGDEFKGCTPEQIKASITDRTAAIHYMAHGITEDCASKDCSIVPLEKVIEIAHRHGIPVIVDAAFQCFPKDGFKKFVAMGVDATAYSCKYFGGPNNAGILIGKKELIDAVALHSFVAQEGGPGGEDIIEIVPGQPRGSVFRGCKMDRASIIGALASLEEFLATDHKEVFRRAHEKIHILKEAWKDIPGVGIDVYDVGTVPEEPGKISLHLVLDRTPEETESLVKELLADDLAIWTSSQGNHLVVNITSFRALMLFEEKDTEIIADRIGKILTRKAGI